MNNNLDELLRANPRAAEHETSIRETLAALQKLKDAGVLETESLSAAPRKGGGVLKGPKRTLDALTKLTFRA